MTLVCASILWRKAVPHPPLLPLHSDPPSSHRNRCAPIRRPLKTDSQLDSWWKRLLHSPEKDHIVFPCSACKYLRDRKEGKTSFHFSHLTGHQSSASPGYLLCSTDQLGQNPSRLISHFVLELAKCFVNNRHTLKFVEKWMIVIIATIYQVHFQKTRN